MWVRLGSYFSLKLVARRLIEYYILEIIENLIAI